MSQVSASRILGKPTTAMVGFQLFRIQKNHLAAKIIVATRIPEAIIKDNAS